MSRPIKQIPDPDEEIAPLRDAQSGISPALASGRLKSAQGFLTIPKIQLFGPPPPGSGLTPTIPQQSVTQYNITWTFDQVYEVGQFVTGDFFVVAPNGCTIVNISPAPQLGGDWLHGSMVNPPTLKPATQGYYRGVAAKSFNETFRVYAPLTLAPNSSLVSTNCWPTAVEHFDIVGVGVDEAFHRIKDCAVLTILSEVPPEFSFRPTYSDHNKTIYQTSDIDFGKLPRLPVPAEILANDFDDVAAVNIGRDHSQSVAKQFARYVQRPWGGLHVRDYLGRQIHPTENMPNYWEQCYDILSEISVLLMLDLADDFNSLLYGFLQLGIDTFGCAQSGTKVPDSSCARWPILLAGILFNDFAMQNVSNNFRTENQTYRVSDGTSPVSSSVVPPGFTWTGSIWGWRQDPGNAEHEHLDPPSEWSLVPVGGGG